MSEFKQYKRTNIAEMRPLTQREIGGKINISISISEADKHNGSPKEGDMIARNPNNHKDKWLVAKEYFENNFEPFNKVTKLDLILGVAKRLCRRELEITKAPNFPDEHKQLFKMIKEYETNQVDIIPNDSYFFKFTDLKND